ncbi:MAG: cytochrome c [Saprospiraceae bacterium]|nr:cytochrome c [Saprospiraceae bacterium]
MKSSLIILLLGSAICLLALAPRNAPDQQESVAALLELFGDSPSPNRPNMDIPFVSMERGRDLVLHGKSKLGGRTSRRQSKHFTCTSCHNVVKEDPDLADPSPEARLQYAADQGLPYLQGSPLYGIVNRTSFYNGDYEKKYGDLVKPTRNNIREAIQLCAIECSQGRPLADFEMESVLAYLWTLDLKLGDLNLTEDEMATVRESYETGRGKSNALNTLKSKFMDFSPATFINPITGHDEEMKNMTGDVTRGQQLYELSCQHCHLKNNYSYLILDDEDLTFRYLKKNFDRYRNHSLGQVVRYGTYPKGGKKAYMPLYTQEKMTNQQLADLRAYIELKAS